MKKKEIKKIGYKRIIKQNESHQKVYDDLKTPIPANNLTIAKELSQIPSKSIIESFKTLRIVYLVLILFFLLLRLIGIYVLSQSYNANNSVLFFGILFGLLVPGLGIYGILAHKLELCKSVSIILILSLVRVLGKIELTSDTLIGLGLTLALIILGFVLNSKMITPYKKTVIYKDGDKRNVSFAITFEDGITLPKDDDILDDF